MNLHLASNAMQNDEKKDWRNLTGKPTESWLADKVSRVGSDWIFFAH